MEPANDTPITELHPNLAGLRSAWQGKRPDYAQRRDDLQRLRDALKRRLQEMADTVAADFGHRSRHETLLADGMTVLNEIDHLRSHLRGWMKPTRVGVGWRFWPARAEVRSEPVGVVGVIAPWNYPVNLALIPLATAIAAGNHVYLKPSEHTPRTTDLAPKRTCRSRTCSKGVAGLVLCACITCRPFVGPGHRARHRPSVRHTRRRK